MHMPNAPQTTRRNVLKQCAAAALGWATVTWLGAAQAQAPDGAAVALPAELASELPAAQLQGSAKLRFLGMDIYEARLWTPSGFNAGAYAQQPFALELIYQRGLSGKLIAERSIKEMRRQGSLGAEREQAWLDAMVQAFPDVKNGDRITGLHTPGVGARFWFNGQSRGAVRDADFSRTFFGIWLSDATSEPQLRAKLLGRSGG